MKIKESIWHEAAQADKKNDANRTNNAAPRHQSTTEQANAANRNRQTSAPLKEDAKFASFLESSAKLQKAGQRQEDSSEQRDDDRKKDKKHAGDKDSTELKSVNDDQTEKQSAFGGQAGSGGQSGFGANVNQLNLSENFAARSILHIADLERLISSVRTQINLGGKREMILQLKRSVLEGLQVKITTDPTKSVQIEFLAANETVRSQITAHSQELAEILRGRGINLKSLTSSLEGQNKDSAETQNKIFGSRPISETGDSIADNTFAEPLSDDKLYQA